MLFNIWTLCYSLSAFDLAVSRVINLSQYQNDSVLFGNHDLNSVSGNQTFDSLLGNPLVDYVLGNEKHDTLKKASLIKLFKTLEKFYLPVEKDSQNKQCDKVLNRFLYSLSQKLHSWALKMFDSWGKFPSDGYLFGNYHILGMLEECLKVNGKVKDGKEDIDFKGKYCRIFVRKVSSPSSTKASYTKYFIGLLELQYATCMPSVCTDQHLHASLNKTFDKLGLTVVNLECQDEDNPYRTREFDVFDAFVCGLLLFLVFTAICGTIVEENNIESYGNYPARRCLEILKLFSLTRSFRMIFTYKKGENTITSIHGLRAITLLWIIFTHQAESMAPICNDIIYVFRLQIPWYAQIVMNTYLAADTFFLLSGILISFHLNQIVTNRKPPSGLTYLKEMSLSILRRIMRLSPAIFMVAAFSATLLRFLGFGPRAANLDAFTEICRQFWWRDPIFVNNLIHENADDSSYYPLKCLRHCWYTSVEMQLYFIVPFIILPFIFKKFWGFLCLGFLTLMASLIPMLILIIDELPPILFPYTMLENSYEYISKYFEVPWCRAGPWFVGIWIGILLLKPSHQLKRLNKIYILIGHIIALTLGAAVLLGLYPYDHISRTSNHKIKPWVSATYGFFGPSVWALCVAWVVVTCHLKKARYINKLLSWWGWQPLSRLSFGMYLVSPIVQKWWSTTAYVNMHCSYYEVGFSACGSFFISFVMAMILFSLVEGPFRGMTNSFFVSTKDLQKT